MKIKLDEQTTKAMEDVAVAIIKGNYRITELTQTQEYGCYPTTEISIVTDKAVELNVEMWGV